MKIAGWEMVFCYTDLKYVVYFKLAYYSSHLWTWEFEEFFVG